MCVCIVHTGFLAARVIKTEGVKKKNLCPKNCRITVPMRRLDDKDKYLPGLKETPREKHMSQNFSPDGHSFHNESWMRGTI